MFVEKFMLPTVFDDRCVYSHTNPLGGNKISDNIMFTTTQTIEKLFRSIEPGTRETAEQLVQKRMDSLGKKMCAPSQISVWLVKPSNRLPEQRSIGIRHWFSNRGIIKHEICKNLYVWNKSFVCLGQMHH